MKIPTENIMTSPVIVHLVHGTWPYGLVRRNKKSWFDENSDFRRSIALDYESDITFCVCRWSGKNSVTERKKASWILYKQLIDSINERPNAKHIVIAHSHGGTVAADTLGYVFEPAQLKNICALIALATPFAYLRPVSNEAASFHALSMAAVIASFFTMLIGELFFELSGNIFLFLGWVLMWFFLTFVIDVCSIFPTDYVYMGEPINPKIPVFIFRATRDEAALTLAVAEFLNGILYFISQHFTVNRGRISAAVLAFMINIVAYLYFLTFQKKLFNFDFSEDKIGLFFVSFFTIFYGLGFIGKLFLGIATGMPIRMWKNYRVEVDAAPPYTDCNFRSYSDIDASPSLTMRHGIYDLDLVKNEIRYLIECLITGRPIKFRSIEK